MYFHFFSICRKLIRHERTRTFLPGRGMSWLAPYAMRTTKIGLVSGWSDCRSVRSSRTPSTKGAEKRRSSGITLVGLSKVWFSVATIDFLHVSHNVGLRLSRNVTMSVILRDRSPPKKIWSSSNILLHRIRPAMHIEHAWKFMPIGEDRLFVKADSLMQFSVTKMHPPLDDSLKHTWIRDILKRIDLP